MRKPVTFLVQYLRGKQIYSHLRNEGSTYYESRLHQFGGRNIIGLSETHEEIIRKIHSGEPFMACRFGSNELATVKTFDFQASNKYAHQLARAHTYAGLFPEAEETGHAFAELMIDCIPYADLIGIWPQPFEEYYIRHYASDNLKCTWLKSLEPWTNPEKPWTSALAGKKVLVVHPFIDSIESQYKKRAELFPGTEILPEFELKTVRSVQTSAGETDDRFISWFEALEWLKKECLNTEFDVAILGCGAYGFPLAAELKKAGKQAIHIGGVTQILFGIIGARWDNDPRMSQFINDAWVRPSATERPKDASKIENACYW